MTQVKAVGKRMSFAPFRNSKTSTLEDSSRFPPLSLPTRIPEGFTLGGKNEEFDPPDFRGRQFCAACERSKACTSPMKARKDQSCSNSLDVSV